VHGCVCVQLREKVDVMVSHDWPTSIHRYGNAGQLLRAKPYFREDIDNDCLGSPASWQLLQVRGVCAILFSPGKFYVVPLIHATS
jgi:hypothetical protein